MNKEKLVNYIKATSLPLLLIILFAAQNLAFNFYLGIYVPTYFIRLSLVTLALGSVLYGPALLFKHKAKYIYLFIVSGLISALFIAQFLYFRYSESFLQFSAIKYFWQIKEISSTIFAMLTPNLLIFLLNFILVLIFFIIGRKKKIDFVTPYPEKIIVIIIIAVFVFSGYKYLLYKENQEWGNTSRLFTDVYDLSTLVSKIGTVNFSLEDAAKYFMRSNLITEGDKDFLTNWAKNRAIKTNPDTISNFGDAKGKNLIIIQVESLENSLIKTKFYGQEITPNLNGLLTDGLYFNNYYGDVGPGNTADAEFSTMTSLYPLPDDVAFVNYSKNKYVGLPKTLKESGYGTYCFHGDVPTFWNRSNIYPELGYDEMFDLNDFVVTRSVGKGPSDLGDEDLFSQTADKLKNIGEPFMATVITMSMHTPFILPEDLQTLELPEKTGLNWLQWEYIESAHYTDKAIGEFIKKLKSEGLYDNSIIFIWGDHSSYTNISSVLDKNQDILGDITDDKVPLIVLNSGLTGEYIEPCSHLDIFPTITNLLGIEIPKTVLGQDLLNSETPVVAHFKVVSGKVDAIVSNELVYKSAKGGEFSEGQCYKMPEETILQTVDCWPLYKQQSDTIKASNIIIRGNLLDVLR
jgi:phosphoglycerol transferase MdoB-like AlkP superfamily enzyme